MLTSPRAASALAVLRRNPAFARVYAAQLISFGGDWFMVVALQALVLETTGRPALAGLMLAVQMLPMAIVSPFAGVVIDRLDRRVVMIVADVVRALLALGLLLARSESTLWIAYVCVALLSAFSAFFEPASSAAIPNLVRREDLPVANVLIGSAWGTMLAIGAAAGGVVAATLGREAAFVGDALSFVISGALLLSVRAHFQEERAPRTHGVTAFHDVAETIRFARHNPLVSSLLLVKGGFGLAGGLIALISIMAVEVFRSGDTGIGVLMSGRGIGALVGPFLFRRIFGTEGRSLFRAIACAFTVFAVGYALFGAAPVLPVAALGTLIAHLGGGAQWTMSSLGLQRYTPDYIRGRIFAMDYTLIALSMAISIALTGWLADRFGPRPIAFALSATAFAWTMAWTAITRRFWPDAETP